MKKTTILSLLILMACIASLSAGGAPSSIGLHFGTSAGNGYAMRWMGDKIGWQTTLGLYTWGLDDPSFADQTSERYESNETPPNQIIMQDKGRKTFGSIAFNSLIMLDKFNDGKFYLIAGGNYEYIRRNILNAKYNLDHVENAGYANYAYYNLVPDSEFKSSKQTHRWTVGVGPGVELNATRHLHFAIELPLTINQKGDIVMYIPQAGIYYYFN